MVYPLFGWVEKWRERNWVREKDGETDIFSCLDGRRKWEGKKTREKKMVGPTIIFFFSSLERK